MSMDTHLSDDGERLEDRKQLLEIADWLNIRGRGKGHWVRFLRDFVSRLPLENSADGERLPDPGLTREEAETTIAELDAMGLPTRACETCRGKGEIEMQPSTNPRPCPDCGGTGLSPENSEENLVDLRGKPALVELPSGEIAPLLGYVVGHEDGELEVFVRDDEGFDRDELLAALTQQSEAPENSSGETDRQRADRLEVECAELEDANRSLAKMRDAALEGNLAVADEPARENSSGVEEGRRDA